jgi:hypothetical protein
MWGIVGLVRHYPRRLINSACDMAIEQGVYSYGHVKTLTEQLMEEALILLDAPNTGEVSLTQSHALIRAGNDYADLFTLGTQQSATLATTPSKTKTTTPAPSQPQSQIEAPL